ncbi:MAG: hypothetical protein IIA54_07710 [Chloroflexi bacterium]|nr:hypothetical protein [Chloroflexota bacterium]
MPTDSFIADYTLWVFLSALGVLQFVAARSGLFGLLFIRRRPRATAYASAALVVASFAWFFGSGVRNLPDTVSGLDGVTQSLWFAVAAAAAVAVTFLGTSAINHRWGAGHRRDPSARPPTGLDVLERTTFARALWAASAALRSRGR